MELQGKVSVVTGAADGICKELARKLSAQGSDVAIIDINDAEGKTTERELRRDGVRVKYYHCDLRDVAEIHSTFEDIELDFGMVDILINGAGLANRTAIEDITEEEWDLLNSVNIKGAFFAAQSAVRIMKKHGYGRIVNVGSIRGIRSDGHHTIYDITKAGMIAMTRSFAVALGEHGINTNCVSLAYILTPMTMHNLNTPGWKERVLSHIPRRELISIDEAADTVLFLCSDKASGINGADIVVDGGWTANE